MLNLKFNQAKKEILFAPTDRARQNLLREGIKKKKIFVTGNTVIDAMRTTISHDFNDKNLEWAKDSRLILLTAHRRENLGEPMRQMFLAVKRIIEEFQDVKVIYPVHLNPKVRREAEDLLAGVDRIRLIEPLDVMSFHNYISNSYFVLTDSGGIQEEAPALNKPVLVMRSITERPEGVAAGTLKLVGTDTVTIYESVKSLLTDQIVYEEMSRAINPYGDGHASERIVEEVLKYARNINCSTNL